MNKIPQEIIERIKSAANIVDVIQNFVGLRKKGVNYVGVCPFHDDTSPSMFVSPAKQIFKCFACGTGGDVINFVMKYERISYPEALRYLGKKYNIEIPEVELTHEELERVKRRESLYIILNKTQEIFEKNLKDDNSIEKYLTEARGISPEVLQRYKPGYAVLKNKVNQLLQTFISQGYDTDLIVASGVVCRSENGSLYDHLRNRITFPFMDIAGRITGFTGRSLNDDSYSRVIQVSKYSNTSDTDLFHKGKTLFGLYQARQEIVRRDEAILVEGQFDVLSMVQKGFSNTVCGSGTALTDDQVKLISRFTKNVTVIYDGDQAGIEASLKNTKTLLSHDMHVRLVALPKGEDPDSFARKVTDIQFANYKINNSQDFIAYFHKVLAGETDDPYKKEDTLIRICDCLSVMPEGSLRSGQVQLTAQLFGLEISDIKAKIKPPVDMKKPDVWGPGFYGIEESQSLLIQVSHLVKYLKNRGKKTGKSGDNWI
jgi:DNA primase catalytic core